MPESMPEIPDELTYLLTTNVPAHVTLTKADGTLVTHVMWIDYDGRHILIGSPEGSYKGRAFRARPQLAISVVDPSNQWRRLSITGRVTGIRDDAGLALINKLSMRYTGQPYQRTTPRDVFEVTPDIVRPMLGRRTWTSDSRPAETHSAAKG